MTGDFAIDVFYAQTAFEVSSQFAFIFHDFGVYEDRKFPVFFLIEITSDYDDPFESINLYSGESGADLMGPRVLPVYSGISHIDSQLFYIVVDNTHLFGFLAQMLVW